MYARVTSGQVRPGAIDAGPRIWEQQATPVLQEVPGFQDIYFLADRDTNDVLVMILFESREASDAYINSRARDRILELGRDFFMGFPSIKEYEVLYRAG